MGGGPGGCLRLRVVYRAVPFLPAGALLSDAGCWGGQVRFNEPKAADRVVGPGAYDTSSPWVKKSHNVTFRR